MIQQIKEPEKVAEKTEANIGYVVARISPGGYSQIVGKRGGREHAKALAVGALLQTPQNQIVVFKPISIFENGD